MTFESSKEIEKLVEDGFTERMAKTWLAAMERERRSGLYDEEYLEWAHGAGFLAESALSYGLGPGSQGAEAYFSDRDWHRLWPLNDWQRIWVNDKLTLKHMLDGTRYGGCMPDYYFYTDATGSVVLLTALAGSSKKLLGGGRLIAPRGRGRCLQALQRLGLRRLPPAVVQRRLPHRRGAVQ